MANIPFKRLVYYMQDHQFLKTTPPSATVFQNCFFKTKAKRPTVSVPESSSLLSFTVQYLMNTYGLPLETALSTSQKLQLEEKKSENHESVLTLLKSLQFSNAHIAKLVAKRPGVLQSKVDNNLKPKLQYLIDKGFMGSLLPELIASNPIILSRSLNAHIKPSVEFLKTYLETDDKVIAAIKRTSWLLTYDLKGTMQPNIEFLLTEGVPNSSISKLIMVQPRTILQKVDRLVHAVETVKKLGLIPSTPMFVHAVRVILSMSDSTWKRKVELLKSLGWSDEEITSVFKRGPLCLACSEDKIKSVMDFYVNTMQLEPAFIAAYPKFPMYSKDARIWPRYNVKKVLEAKKLLKEDKKLVWILTRTKKDFLNTYVNKHLDQVPGLMELYHGTITANKIDV